MGVASEASALHNDENTHWFKQYLTINFKVYN